MQVGRPETAAPREGARPVEEAHGRLRGTPLAVTSLSLPTPSRLQSPVGHSIGQPEQAVFVQLQRQLAE
jgi:hypothetical protein